MLKPDYRKILFSVMALDLFLALVLYVAFQGLEADSFASRTLYANELLYTTVYAFTFALMLVIAMASLRGYSRSGVRMARFMGLALLAYAVSILLAMHYPAISAGSVVMRLAGFTVAAIYLGVGALAPGEDRMKPKDHASLITLSIFTVVVLMAFSFVVSRFPAVADLVLTAGVDGVVGYSTFTRGYILILALAALFSLSKLSTIYIATKNMPVVYFVSGILVIILAALFYSLSDPWRPFWWIGIGMESLSAIMFIFGVLYAFLE